MTNHTAQQWAKQWNRTDKANSSYSRHTKRNKMLSYRRELALQGVL